MQFQLSLFLHLGWLSGWKAEDECGRGACRPSPGNLLVGRSAQLTASSTCGLKEAQQYCILSYLEGEHKCFICDSRLPYNPHTQPNSHTIENVIPSFEPHREKTWWQSENGLDHVSIRLDLETLFQFSHLILTFKTFRPAAMLVERSTNYGHTWKVLKYFAKDCAISFPGITAGQAQKVGDLVCDSRYSDVEPSTGGEVVLKVLDPSFEIENPYSPQIQDLVTLTNLRINFTKLHTLGDTLLGKQQNDSLDKYYYALYEMIVRGSCFCNGHANKCEPLQQVQGDVFSSTAVVHGHCVCQHNTDGPNCERCKDFFQDAPWRPAVGAQDSACRACSCNGHSERCHFDMTTYLASGGLSGGVCEDCQHHTEGQHCERCRPLFYRDPFKAISDPYACLPCECDPDGTLSGGICVSHSDPSLGSVAGQCLCKENVEGAKCDQCKPSYFGLSASDPLGCRPCGCHPLGSLPFSTCDVDTGQCFCRAYTTGPHCEECTTGSWGLGDHLHGCAPCDCAIGGAYSNMCSPKDGQCDCRPHVTGRRCTEPAPGYFFAPLNFYLYEAEEASPLQGLAPLANKFTFLSMTFGQVSAVHIVLPELEAGSPVTWTGPGFARVLPGAGLRFAVNNIPFPMDFTIVVHYETQTAADWTVRIVVNPLAVSDHCIHRMPQLTPLAFTLPAASRLTLLPTPICLGPDVQYSIDLYFSQPLEGESHAHSYILVDSLGLVPHVNSLEGFCSKQDMEEYQMHGCAETAWEVEAGVVPEACERLVVSLSAQMHDGAVACKCHPQGAVGTNCSRLGGQCQCKPLVAGRCCDKCSAGSYSLGHHGCHPCHCHPEGSKSTVCDQVTGQCACHGEVTGRRCDRCLDGYFGFPSCHPCSCHGFSELCDPDTGSCFNCGGFTTGKHCERCIDGYYGNPTSGQSCRPCLCPDGPSSDQYFAQSCSQSPWSSDIICNCLQGYSGTQCEECAPGFYGNPRVSGEPCRPCACNNNIDVTDPESCSRVTGECLRCLHNTWGPHCQLCQPGHFGSALNQTCKRCSCHPSGVNPPACPPDAGVCLCDPVTGVCPCLPHVTGLACDSCADGYWNLVPGRGCQPCNCDPQGSQSSRCDQLTGQCPCKLGHGGKRCSECKENYYSDPSRQCIPCKCNSEGTRMPLCDPDTGMCHCREGVSGQQCDHCARGHNQEFPACLPCHFCFDQWDHTISSLSKAVQGLIANMEDKRETLTGCEVDFQNLRENVSAIERLLKQPLHSPGEFLKVKDYHDSVRKQFMQLSEQLKTVYEFKDLKETIERMENETDILLENLQEEVDLQSSILNANIIDSSENITKYYHISESAEKKTNETSSIINNSENTRNNLLTILDTVTSKEDLLLRKLEQIKVPDIQKLNEKVCGEQGSLPCNLSSCGGSVCTGPEGLQQYDGPGCQGLLTLSRNILQKAQEAEAVIHHLENQTQGLTNQIKNISELAEVSGNNAIRLSMKLENMKNQRESEEKKLNFLIKKAKKILLEENVPPEDIEKVANRVLNIHLPITSQNLTHELDEIQTFVQLCEDYRIDVNRLNKAADGAQKLLVKAKAAEKAADGLLNLDKTLNKMQQAQITQRQTNTSITQLTVEITKIKKNVLQAENQAKEIKNKLNFTKQQLELEDELTLLQTKWQRSQDLMGRAKSQADSALHQAGRAEKEFVELENQYAILEHETSARGLTMEAWGKVIQLKEAAVKLAEETEDKITRIAELEKKIQDLNVSRQEKADQLKQLEHQVVAIKNEIVEREKKYAICYN
ncbi:laminin subunit beta-4 [Dipodomys spectabilis]|uniref:laminin subunit beta-4 n=1 Tax=Dipodomys spectabilis TaxID=105255 RepID=UPI001C5416E3|nr:laminin subunit beta-4 [Dipodomys spectabilis]